MVAGAELSFEAGSFRGVGIDRILAACGASTRTLYKHFGSRDGLVLAVLDSRHRHFMARLGPPSPDPVGGLFAALERWLDDHGARGCLLLRARGEYAGANPDVVDLVRRQKDEFERVVADRVTAALGRPDAELARQVWLLVEGATAAASVADLSVVGAARRAADVLLAGAKGRTP